MFSMLLVYGFLTIPKFVVFFGILTGVCASLLFCALMYRGLEVLNDAQKRSINRLFKIVVPTGLFCGSMTVAIPDKETSYAMAAAYVAQEAVQSELGQSAIALLQANINEALEGLDKKETKK